VLREHKPPLLVIWGRNDPVFPPVCAGGGQARDPGREGWFLDDISATANINPPSLFLPAHSLDDYLKIVAVTR
jgi:hypothetical protein